MGHLDKLHETMAEKGLTIIALTKQDRSAVDKFIEETGAKHPIVIESSDSMRAYGATGWPTTFLIDPGGRVVFRGNVVPDSKIEEVLESVKILPDFPKSLKAVRKAFDKGAYADALGKVQKLIEKGKLAEADQKAAEGIAAWITWFGESSLEAAAGATRDGKHYEAWKGYDELTDSYKGHEIAKQADAAADGLLADDEKKAEIKAGDKLAKLKLKIRDMSPKKAIKALGAMTGKKYRDTRAGKEAADLIKALEARQP